MKLTVQQIADFNADARKVSDYVAEHISTAANRPVALGVGTAADRIRELARELMAVEVKVS